MSEPTLTYPPTAHIVSTQPAPSNDMSIERKPTDNKPMRLRGGCIPCPVSGAFIRLMSSRAPNHYYCRPERRLLLHHTPPLLLKVPRQSHRMKIVENTD